MEELRFDGRVAIVTGAGRGIGREHALLLARRGAAVVVNDLGCELNGSGASNTPAQDVVETIVSSGAQAVANFASVADEAGAESIVQDALDNFGRLDIVINNAGIAQHAPFAETPPAFFRTLMDIHYFGTLYVTRAAWDHLAASGCGRLVNTASTGVLGEAYIAGYAAAKGAVWSLTRSLAVEGMPLGIKANCLAPGAATRQAADPKNTEEVFGDDCADLTATRLDPRLVSPVVALLAHETCPVTGELITSMGGRVSRLFMGDTRGRIVDELTPEFVAEHWPEIADRDQYRIYGRTADFVTVLLEEFTLEDNK